MDPTLTADGESAVSLAATPAARAAHEQVYLLERDAGLMCRLLGLYAARGLDVAQARYAHAAQGVMMLEVQVAAPAAAEELRTLVAKAGALVGVIAAAQRG
jgi:hypothetical protein